MRTSRSQRAQTLLVAAIVVVILMSAGFAVRSAHYPNECKAETDSQQGTQQQQIEETIWCPSTWAPITTFTCMLVIATAGLWLFTAMLWLATSRAVADSEKAIGAAVKAAEAANLHVAEAARAAAAMEEANKVSRENFAAARRPWLSVEIGIADKLRLINSEDSEAGCQIGFSISIKNVGNSLASKVFVLPNLIFQPLDRNIDLSERQSSLSIAAKGWRLPSLEQIIFPGETRIQHHLMMASYTDKDAAEKASGAVSIILIGCIDYEFPLSSEHHQTWFSGEVRAAKYPNRIIDRKDGEISADELTFIDPPSAQKHAD